MAKNEEFYLGVDCGSSQTRAVIVGAQSQTVAESAAGPCNPNLPDRQDSIDQLRRAIQMVLERAGIEIGSLSAALVGMAGVGGPTEMREGQGILTAAGLTGKFPIGLETDLRIALAGGLAGREGIVLIAGTGSSCYGRRDDGRSWKAGGWGPILDDGGSAYGLGHAGMCAAVRIADGRFTGSSLLNDMLTALGLSEPREIVGRLHRAPVLTKAEIARLAQTVLKAWQAGDIAAKRIVQQGAEQLAELVTAVAIHLELPTPDICWAGGLIDGSTAYREIVSESIQTRLPGANLVAPRMSPQLGAAWLARQPLESIG
jgi:N-acetylglucosamine kinase-like BadF-type ATPase